MVTHNLVNHNNRWMLATVSLPPRTALQHATTPYNAKISGMPLRNKIKKVAHAAGKLVRGRKGEPRAASELVIITGMSGSGKASALKAFEDLGFYCVDNLPVELIPRFAEPALPAAEPPRPALVVVVREGSLLENRPAILTSAKRTLPTRVIY